MSNTQKSEALRLVDKYEVHGFLGDHHFAQELWCRQAATELRSQHARIAELEAVLSAMGEKGNPVKPADIPRATDQDTHFFLAGWNGRAAQVDPHEHFRNAAATAPADPAEGVPAQIETLRAELAEETEAAENWRRLALQFDHHRLQALGHLKAILHPDSSVDEYKTAELFLKSPPLDGESVLAQRIAELSTATQAQADAQDTDRWMGIGKAIERACMDLPDGTEISVTLEKDAGTVTLIDQDGNEHENFSTDYGFAGVLNEAIDAAIAAQAKKGEQE